MAYGGPKQAGRPAGSCKQAKACAALGQRRGDEPLVKQCHSLVICRLQGTGCNWHCSGASCCGWCASLLTTLGQTSNHFHPTSGTARSGRQARAAQPSTRPAPQRSTQARAAQPSTRPGRLLVGQQHSPAPQCITHLRVRLHSRVNIQPERLSVLLECSADARLAGGCRFLRLQGLLERRNWRGRLQHTMRFVQRSGSRDEQRPPPQTPRPGGGQVAAQMRFVRGSGSRDGWLQQDARSQSLLVTTALLCSLATELPLRASQPTPAPASHLPRLQVAPAAVCLRDVARAREDLHERS